jgi:hypothetical protein
MRGRRQSEHVVEVRVEAPADVDDIVVKYADGHRDWIQVKENLRRRGEPWKQMWSDFEAQRWSDQFKEHDRLVLVAGAIDSSTYEDLGELCSRADGAPHSDEWVGRLNSRALSLLEKVRAIPSRDYQNNESLFEMFRCLEVWPLYSLEQIERDQVPLWMPESSVQGTTLFALLRDSVGGHARRRKVFQAASLLEELASDHQIIMREPPMYGVSAYRRALAEECSILGVPGTPISARIEALYVWPMLRETRPQPPGAATEEQEYRVLFRLSERGAIDLRDFPHATLRRAVVAAGAGFGKTALVTALARRLSGTTSLPAMVSLARLAESGQTVIQFLKDTVNREFNVAIPWEYYCDSGRAVILFDGLDELSASDRARAFKSVLRFSARYSDPPVAWVLTVRDAAALPGPVGASVLTVGALDDEEIGTFAEAYRRAGSRVEPSRLLAQLERHRDLHLLARIPLFLALLMATTRESEALPRNRADLIERYLHVLFHPAAYKPTVQLHSDPGDLRRAAEEIAFGALERQRVALTEQEMAEMLATPARKHTCEEYVEDLTACGLIRRSFNLISFAFPTVQEYLAGCYLAEHRPGELADRFQLCVRRPWAQTVQFALERHPDAENLIGQLLAERDEAFGAGVRLIAQCIVNGTAVSRDIRNQVGARLAHLWTTISCWTVQEEAGLLIADGFVDPLPATARAALERGWATNPGAGAIITACKDPTLTRAVLGAVLRQHLRHTYYLHDWQTAVDDIAREALELYVGVAKTEGVTQEELEALASLVAELSPVELDPGVCQSIGNDCTLPSIIRLATWLLCARPLPAAALILSDEVIRAPVPEGHYTVPGWRLACDALWRSEGPIALWQTYVADTMLSERRRMEVLFAIVDSPLDTPSRVAVLERLAADDALSPDMRHSVLLLRAYMGDAEAMRVASGLLAGLSPENRTTWAFATSKHRSGRLVQEALGELGLLELEPDERVRLAGDLAFGMTTDVELLGSPGSASGSRRILHPAASEAGRLVWRWAREWEGDPKGAIHLMRAACELGYPGSPRALADKVGKTLRGDPDLLADFDLDLELSSALYALENAGQSPPLDTLKRCVDVSRWNAGSAAASLIASLATEEGLDSLLALHRVKRGPIRDNLTQYIEALARRLGARLSWDDGELIRDAS